jgi:RNA polymerase sigma-70 factor (ECF subfamily)
MKRDSCLPNSVLEMAELARLIEEYGPRLSRMVQRRLDPALAPRLSAEDILSEAFLLARQKWNSFDHKNGMTPYAWLYRVVMDCLIEAWRRENRACRSPDREMPWPERSSVQLALSLMSPGTSPSSAAARNEVQGRIRQALDMLSPRDKEILWMRHFDELSFKEAAAVLGIKESAANVRYVRALKRLRDLWLQLHPKHGGGNSP